MAGKALRFDRVGKGIEDQLARLQAMLQEMNERGLPGGAGAADGVQTAVADEIAVVDEAASVEALEPETGTEPASDTTPEPAPTPQPLPVPAVRDEYGLQPVTGVAGQLGLGFHLGSAVERIATASALGRSGVAPLREAVWLIERYVDLLQQRPIGADLHASSLRLQRTGNGIERMKQLAAELEAASAHENGHALALELPPPPREPELEPERESDQEPEPEPGHPPLRHELALIIVRWVVIVAAVVAIVFIVTLISDWR